MRIVLAVALSVATATVAVGAPPTLKLTRAEYEDRARAVWTAQVIAVVMGWPFEHKPAAVQFVDRYPNPVKRGPVDDDWYYEIVLLRALERHGPDLTVEQLGAHWLAHNTGTWGASEQARLLLARGVQPPRTGHPLNNRLWFTMGNQCRGDLFGLLAPGRPNLAADLARRLGHINSYAEGTDGGVLVAGMISLAFCERDPRKVVRQAARLLAPETPHRRLLDDALAMADRGRTFHQIVRHIEDRWRIEYPASNNAVANGGIAAMAVYFGEGDFLKSVNLAYGAADFTDADCNGAVAGAVVAAMHGMKALPRHLVEALSDTIAGDHLGPVPLTPPVRERISDLARRTAAAGEAFLRRHGSTPRDETLVIRRETPVALPAELFHPNDFARHWDAAWTLERAGYGAPGGGVRNLRGGTFLDEGVLSTYPRDEVRGVVLRREVRAAAGTVLALEVAADPGRAWQLAVHVDNEKVLTEVVDGGPQVPWKDLPPLSQPQTDHVLSTQHRRWRALTVDLSAHAGKEVTVRLIQTVLVRDRVPGNAYWRSARIEQRASSALR